MKNLHLGRNSQLDPLPLEALPLESLALEPVPSEWLPSEALLSEAFLSEAAAIRPVVLDAPKREHPRGDGS